MDQNSVVFYRILDRYFSSSKGTHDYGIDDVNVSEDLNSINIVLRFKTGSTYCCPELTCHFKPDWDKIRELANKEGVTLLKPLQIKFHVIVQTDVLFTANIPSNNSEYEYEEVFSEEI